MRRILTAAIAVTLAGMAMGPPSSAATRLADSPVAGQQRARADWRAEECRYQSLDRAIWTAREERLTAACAVGKWLPGQLGYILAIGDCESGWWRFANNGGRYLGLFQHAASSYVGRIAAYQPVAWDHKLSTRWTNSRGQIVMSVRMMRAVGFSPWACA